MFFAFFVFRGAGPSAGRPPALIGGTEPETAEQSSFRAVLETRFDISGPARFSIRTRRRLTAPAVGLAIGSKDGTLAVYGFRMAALLALLFARAEVTHLGFTPDGAHVLSFVVERRLVRWRLSDEASEVVMDPDVAPDDSEAL